MRPLRPFFSYFGSKWSLTRRGVYPEPLYSAIVEPFAGSAGYSLHHHELDVHLYDANPVIVGIWRFLIGATAADILALPADGRQAVSELSGAPRDFVGFWLARGSSYPRRTPSPWMRSREFSTTFWGERVRERIAGQVERIDHWRADVASYEDTGEGAATWFVDPPYQGRCGRHYRSWGSLHMDYAALGAWCRRRAGQVLVCESDEATWLPFRNVAETQTFRGRSSTEALWCAP